MGLDGEDKTFPDECPTNCNPGADLPVLSAVKGGRWFGNGVDTVRITTSDDIVLRDPHPHSDPKTHSKHTQTSYDTK